MVNGADVSGWTGDGPDPMTADGDFGCDSYPNSGEDGVWSHTIGEDTMRDDPRKYRHRDNRPHTVQRRGDLILRYIGDDAAAVTGKPYVVRRVYDDGLLDGATQLASGTLAEMEEVFKARTAS